MMNRQILILYNISRKLRSINDKLILSSSELGELLGVSQQTASRYLLELEGEGLIKRRKLGRVQEIEITVLGIIALREIHKNLGAFLRDGDESVVIEGRVTRGIGEGAYYVREYMQKFMDKLGIIPFPGTLNIKVSNIPDIERYCTGKIEGFEKEGRSFGNIKFVPVMLRVNEKTEDCFLIIPERTHYKDGIEIISEFNLRDKFGLRDGDSVSVEITD
ncbi:MAG TPA: DUF120 domain-containing protein [Candidatus Altiarchaeales archaeon]|nr:DUF120 domain-containing protein [Candidatus Altiarchaeales archaeon]